MVKIIWTEPALQDLDAIADYVALDKPIAARKLVQQVFAKVERLQKFPRMGSIPPELRGLPYRQLVIPPCRVFYRIRRKSIHILHIMRAEQLLRGDVIEGCNSI